MKRLSPSTGFLPGWTADPLDRRIALARLSLALEKLLPRLWPAFGFAGAYLAAALLGVLAMLPWPAEALLLAATLTATALALAEGMTGFTWPGTVDAARRLERDSGLRHRPVSERDDVLAVGGDPFAAALWAAHRARPLPGRYRVTGPRADIAARDPRGLRYVLLVALAAGLVLARGDTAHRLLRAIDSGAGAAAGVDAWLDPPPYTGEPLRVLHADDSGVITVPEGTVLNLRVHGAPRTPGLAAGSNTVPRFAGGDGEYASNIVLAHDAHVRVQVGGHALRKWNIHAVPDLPPSIAFAGTPVRTEQMATKFPFKASDDYGLAGVHAIITPHGRRGKPLVVDLPLNILSAKQVTQNSFVDLTAHPYAGLMVDARLEARDAIGQKSLSAPVTFRLPARVFTDPLARALIEQRQILATADIAQRRFVAFALDALTIAPDRFYQDRRNIFTAIRAAYWGVMHARRDADIAHVENILWQTALQLERGGLLSAAAELRKLQAQLTQAMLNGAPQEVIDELMKRYNQAMQRYLSAMAANPAPRDQAPAPDAKTIGMPDINALMKMIQQLSQSGDRDQAAKLLAMLQSMLENLRMTESRSGSGGMAGQQSPQEKARNGAIAKLGEMMGKQRGLLDRTFRQGQNQSRSQGRQGQPVPGNDGTQALAGEQGALQRELEQTMKSLGSKSGGKMQEALKAMGDAKAALDRKDLANAGNAQNRAMEAMRQGAEDLAKMGESEDGQKQGKSGKDDPLGRSTTNLGGSGVKLPQPSELAEARRILQELRRRAGEMGRPQQERDYLDRLLKAF